MRCALTCLPVVREMRRKPDIDEHNHELEAHDHDHEGHEHEGHDHEHEHEAVVPSRRDCLKKALAEAVGLQTVTG